MKTEHNYCTCLTNKNKFIGCWKTWDCMYVDRELQGYTNQLRYKFCTENAIERKLD